MKALQDYEQDIASIRSVMERSSKFLSLSGFSGILAGVYALLGASAAYYITYYPGIPAGLEFHSLSAETTIIKLASIAIVVLLLAISTAYALSFRKAKKSGNSLWSKSSKQMQLSMLIPLLSGGLFILILMMQGYYGIIAPTCLIFYGLSLVNASQYTFGEVRYLGFTEICLGLLAALLPGYGLLFWATGFGLMHIVYGTVMYYRHEK